MRSGGSAPQWRALRSIQRLTAADHASGVSASRWMRARTSSLRLRRGWTWPGGRAASGAARPRTRRGTRPRHPEAAGIAADLVERGQAVVAVEGGVLRALGHRGAGDLLEAQEQVALLRRPRRRPVRMSPRKAKSSGSRSGRCARAAARAASRMGDVLRATAIPPAARRCDRPGSRRPPRGPPRAARGACSRGGGGGARTARPAARSARLTSLPSTSLQHLQLLRAQHLRVVGRLAGERRVGSVSGSSPAGSTKSADTRAMKS